MPSEKNASRMYAKCPYFCDESAKAQKIVCAGLEQGQTLQLYFRSEKKRQDWLTGKCCSWNFGKCPLHRTLAEVEE